MIYFSQEEAKLLDRLLLSTEYGFQINQLMELAGYAVAQAICDFYIGKKNVLVCCGPGNNGGDGLVAARHLKSFGFSPEIYIPVLKPAYESLVAQCKAFGLPILTGINNINSYDLIVDAIFGFGFNGKPRSPFKEVIETISKSKIPIVSVDVPSGWPIDSEPDETCLHPEVLISLSVPVFAYVSNSQKMHFRKHVRSSSKGRTFLAAGLFHRTSFPDTVILVTFCRCLYTRFGAVPPIFPDTKQCLEL